MNEKDLPKVSVIVINFKGTRQLEKCLRYLERTKYPKYEVIVVDCLTDGIKSWLKETFPKVNLIHYEYDIGASASHNVSERFLDPESKYLVFLDNDAYVTEEWLTGLVKFMESDEKIGAAQAKIVLAKEATILDHVGLAIDALGTWHTLRGIRADSFRKILEVFAVSSAGCIVRRSVFREAGGFDPDYFIYDDDTDFSFRVRLLGYNIFLVPSAVILHDGEPTRFLSPKKLYHSVKNRMCTMLKNYEMKNLWWRLSVYAVSVFLAGVVLALAGKIAEAKEVFKSLVYPLVNAKKIWRKRALIQSKRKVRDSILMSKGFLRNDIRPTIRDIKSKLVFIW